MEDIQEEIVATQVMILGMLETQVTMGIQDIVLLPLHLLLQDLSLPLLTPVSLLHQLVKLQFPGLPLMPQE
jgi:hypothetical protein